MRRMPCVLSVNEGREQGGVSAGQGTSGLPSRQQWELPRYRCPGTEQIHLQPSEGTKPPHSQSLGFWSPELETMNFCCLSHLLCAVYFITAISKNKYGGLFKHPFPPQESFPDPPPLHSWVRCSYIPKITGSCEIFQPLRA